MTKLTYTICYLDDDTQHLGTCKNSPDEGNYKKIFERNGHVYFPFEDSIKDLENLDFFDFLDKNNKNIDLILLDHKLSGVDRAGWDIAKRIRENSNYDSIPVVMFSAEIDRESLRKYAFEYGVDYFLDKSELGLKNCNDKLNEIFSLNSVKLRIKQKDLLNKIIDLEKELEVSKFKHFFETFNERFNSDLSFKHNFQNKKKVMAILEELLKSIKENCSISAQKKYVKPLALSAAIEMVLNKDLINEDKLMEVCENDDSNFIHKIVKNHCLSNFSKKEDIKKFFDKINLTVSNYKPDSKYSKIFELIYQKENFTGISENGLMALYEIVNSSNEYPTIIHFYELFSSSTPRYHKGVNVQSSFLDPILKLAYENKLISM